jgi:hypothetical protein
MLSIEKEPSEYGDHMVMLSLSKQKKKSKKGSHHHNIVAKCQLGYYHEDSEISLRKADP